MTDAPIDRVKVTMTNFVIAGIDADGNPVIEKHQAVDYVGTDILDAYVADAQGRGWQSVTTEEVAELPQAVIDGGYTIPEHLNVEA